MSRRDEVRQPVTKRDERLVTRDPWVMTAAERQWLRERPASVAIQPERSTWPLLLGALALFLAALALDGYPALRGALADIPWAKLFNYQPVSPIDPGDRNGLLHK
jgi:hypothetical protein